MCLRRKTIYNMYMMINDSGLSTHSGESKIVSGVCVCVSGGNICEIPGDSLNNSLITYHNFLLPLPDWRHKPAFEPALEITTTVCQLFPQHQRHFVRLVLSEQEGLPLGVSCHCRSFVHTFFQHLGTGPNTTASQITHANMPTKLGNNQQHILKHIEE